jgi:RNA polymerase sigma-70 factor (ECF subfamily)
MQEIWTAVQTLSPKQRDCVMLVYSEGLDHAEAAEVLGCSEPTVSWHLHEARKRLRIILGREVA